MQSILRTKWYKVLLSLYVVIGVPTFADTLDQQRQPLARMSIEDLMQLKVTIASRMPEKAASVAAAVSTITAEDIRRSGATSLPEALRLVPGIHVARIDANRWAISARGFNHLFANKLLVLIDGRSVYTPVFSGVYWDMQDIVLEDIDRIEIIRGPGASVWGANAVNGVINVVTKRSRETTGGLASLIVGTEDHGVLSSRYGFAVGSRSFARTYLKAVNRDASRREAGGESHDAWDSARAGFRADLRTGPNDTLLTQGEIYSGDEGLEATLPLLESPYAEIRRKETDFSGGHALVRWDRQQQDGSALQLQLYYDIARRDDLVRQNVETFDIEVQRRFNPAQRHRVVAGVGYRHIDDSLEPLLNASFDPEARTRGIASSFFQDEIAFIQDRLRLTLGTKLEHFDSTGFELEPSARLWWKVADRHSFWSAISRAVRAPSRASDDLRLGVASFPTALGLPGRADIIGNPAVEGETVIAYEAGHRFMLENSLSVESAIFFHDYDRLLTFEPGAPTLQQDGGYLLLPYLTDSKNNAEATGIELSVDWRPHPALRIKGGYTFLNINATPDKNSLDANATGLEGENPEHQVFAHLTADLSRTVECDAILRHVSATSAVRTGAYEELDLRIAWRAQRSLELSLVGQNLLNPSHKEYEASIVSTGRAEIQRALYGKVSVQF